VPKAAGAERHRWSTARAILALARTNLRYWTSVAPLVGEELRRWREQAEHIGAPRARELALRNLRQEGFTAQAAAMLATLAPRAHRRQATEAIVALEVMYDYLDGLTEQPSGDPIEDGERRFGAYTHAFDEQTPPGGVRETRGDEVEDPYLDALADAVKSALAGLPAIAAVRDASRAAAARSAQAQIRMHAAAGAGNAELRQWAEQAARASGLGWRELLAASASSVIALHALIAAAADPRTTPAEAAAIDAAYRSISALSTILDSLIDEQHDIASGEASFIGLYTSEEELTRELTRIARAALTQARALRNAPQHLTMLAGVVGYFTSNPRARSARAAPITAELHRQLEPSMTPTLAVMRTWRRARSIRARTRGAAAERSASS
jgi:tetraprenyl-beta-curcumene synthase